MIFPFFQLFFTTQWTDRNEVFSIFENVLTRVPDMMNSLHLVSILNQLLDSQHPQILSWFGHAYALLEGLWPSNLSKFFYGHLLLETDTLITNNNPIKAMILVIFEMMCWFPIMHCVRFTQMCYLVTFHLANIIIFIYAIPLINFTRGKHTFVI